MLSDKEQEVVLNPFRALEERFEYEIGSAKETLTEWERAKTIDTSDAQIGDKNILREKISQLERGKTELSELLEKLTSKLKLVDEESQGVIESLEVDRLKYVSVLNTARSLYDHKYTVLQKNEINRRINAINSSRMLNNADMAALQKQWTEILNMKNDRRLDVSRKIFEDRLADWEKLILEKRA